MIRFTRLIAILMTLTSFGCMPKMSVQDIKNMQPTRPPELDRLDALLGDWVTDGEITMAMLDQPLHTTGTNSARWTLDRRFLVEQAQLNMGELGKLTGMSIWSWDPAIRKYRMWWFDSLGETSAATVTYNEKTKTWHMKATGQKYGATTAGRGTLKQIDADTLEWTWKEYDRLGLIQFADMKGTSRRKR